MPKKFYTEKDIEDLFHSGVRSLEVSDDVVLTELAYEKAKRLGFQLIFDRADNPPAAPVRPYLSEKNPPLSKPVIAPVAQATQSDGSDIETRIRSAVFARLGSQVDAKLLDNIIHRVVKGLGMK